MERQADASLISEQSARNSHFSSPRVEGHSVIRTNGVLPERTPAQLRLVVVSTFTVDPVLPALGFWMAELGVEAELSLAPYAQVMQELLNPRSSFSENKRGINILVLRIEDWIRDRTDGEEISHSIEHVSRSASELVGAVGVLRRTSTAALIIYLCPLSSALPAPYRGALQETLDALHDQLSAMSRVYCCSHRDLMQMFPVESYEDAATDRIGHIPYTDDYFTALATLMARRVAALTQRPYKVVVVDCDNTLWKGVCGEDGVDGIEITAAHALFQSMLVRQYDCGMLVCLCSKNNQSDVDAVFSRRPDMVLRDQHLVLSQVNWNAKSANLRALAQELNLSLDSFIFIDDNPAEIEEVRLGCPAVLALQFPTDPADIGRFVRHAWALDHLDVTADARARTEQYRQNRSRRTALESSTDLTQFLSSLNLQVDVAPMQAEQLDRVTELIQRTSQFNLTGIRRQRAELEALWRSQKLDIRVVHARDRFGDYGLVGAVMLHQRAQALEVESFVLSCRVLGRRVEHRIVKALGQAARSAGRAEIVLRYRATKRNRPANEFLFGTFPQYRIESPPEKADVEFQEFVLPVDALDTIDVDASVNSQSAPTSEREEGAAATGLHAAPQAWHEKVLRLSRLPDLMLEIRRHRQVAPRLRDPYVGPGTEIEATVAAIWADALGLQSVGIYEDFFRLNGDSLLAVQVVARIESALGRKLSLQVFFESPRIADIALKLSGDTEVIVPIEPMDSSMPVPLSSAQQRMWFIDRLEGTSAAYHIPVVLRLTGKLDLDLLRQTLRGLIQRHESLRTVFSELDGIPVQHLVPEASLALRAIDLTSASARDRATEAKRSIQQEVSAPFDLKQGPLIRGLVMHLSAQEHTLLLTLHHVISDGWSVGILVRELGVLYAGLLAGTPSSLPVLATQYADYAHWERRWLSTDDSRRQLSFWKDYLQGAPELLELPTEYPRPATLSYRGDSVEVSLPIDLCNKLELLSRRLNLTLTMTLLAAWSIVLYRLSGQKDFVIGLPSANRRRAEFESLIGLFVNTLPIRMLFDEGAKGSEVLEYLRAGLLSAYANQDLPFDRVVEALRPTRSLSYSPIYQVLFVFHNTPRGAARIPGLVVEEQEAPVETAQFDLSLSLQKRPDGAISGGLNYSLDLFSRPTIERWAQYFLSALNELVQDPEINIDRMPLLSDAEQELILRSFNAARADYPTDALAHRVIEAQVRRTPDAIAVVYEGRSLTYAQLNARANQLAHHLIRHGVGPDQVVGICFERGVALVVAILGILKAGGAYVPLDPSYPAKRLEYMLNDADPGILLTQSELLERLPATASSVLALDRDWDTLAREPDDNIESQALGQTSRSLAYVIYTSGSTGKPKGVMVDHQSILNLWSGLARTYEAPPAGGHLAWNASINFDASVQPLTRLMSGDALHLLEDQVRRDASLLLSFTADCGITDIDCTPSQLRAWLDAGLLEDEVSSLRSVLVGGEGIDPQLWRVLAQSASTQFYNVYGPTECTVDSTMACLRGDPGHPHIGKPMPNRKVYILNGEYMPVPLGVIGEIYIGGDGVARGYLSRADLTAQRFIADPFSDASGRMYRTGDLGKWREDGEIEYVGRNDHQVKIRGFRIELGEIEAQILRLPQVQEVAVLAREDVPGDRRLVAYVAPSSVESGEVTAEVLRNALMRVLPEYMIPGAFVVLEKLPLTPNGKLDRRALPAPDSEAYVRRQYEAPRGEVEEILAGIWQELLQVPRVGRRDNFFEMGGHSLLIVQMLERLRRVGLSAQVREVFSSASLADLAGVLTDAVAGQIEIPPNLIPEGCERIIPQMLSLVDLKEEHIERIVQAIPGGMSNVQDIYPLAPLQEGILFHHLMECGHDGSDVYARVLLFSFASDEALGQFVTALQAVIERHDVLRTAVFWDRLPQPVQVVQRSVQLPVEPISLQEDREPLEQIKACMALPYSLDLQRAPLLRLQVATGQEEGPVYALLRTHHIAFDNESAELLLAEAVAFTQGRQHELPKPVPYRNHVAQSLAYARLQDAQTFFRGKLSDAEEPTTLFGVLEAQTGDARDHTVTVVDALEPELAQGIRVQARRLGVSTATLFHAAWGLVVARAAGRDDVVFGSVLLGRLQSIGAQRILGMFINTLPLRLRLRGATARQLVEQTQRELVDLLSHEQASLAEAQRCSAVAGSTPLFSSLLNYRHVSADARRGWSSGVSLLEIRGSTSYPALLSVDDWGEGFGLELELDQRVDPQRVIGYVLTALSALVGALEKAPQIPALSLSVLPPEEREQVLRLFNATQADYPRERLVHELFEEQVRRTPGKVAVASEGQSLTYTQLNTRANQLARYLRDRGVGPDELVGICVERGLDMVVGLLGILKAGGAYVPLDPNYPPERLTHTLSDSGLEILLTQQTIKDQLPRAGAELVALDREWEVIARQDTADLSAIPSSARSRQLAYVIYTSGSTGKPKGVMIEHADVVNFLTSLQEKLQVTAADRLLAVTTISFDIAGLELYLPLVSGAEVIVASRPATGDPKALNALMDRFDVTLMQATPVTWQMLLNSGWQGRLGMKALCGGEALSTSLSEKLVGRVGALWNLYGPTETTIWSSANKIAEVAPNSVSVESIGAPIGNTQVYLLDRQLQPVPIGVRGEIYIGGDGVARGYLSRPDLTAERFIADPFDVEAGRLYRTGDLGKWREDGKIEYLGRNDHQIKIRGFRIELGEIEAQLLHHPKVREAVVVAREDVPGDKRLVAYVVASSAEAVEMGAEELRKALKGALPEYMVPSAFVVLARLPLTPNGKLDRRALPAPGLEAYAARQYVAPRGRIETALADLWRGLLGLERVGREDNFFDLGGHSILGMRLITLIAEKMGAQPSVGTVFQYPTVREMAGLVEKMLLADDFRPEYSDVVELEDGIL